MINSRRSDLLCVLAAAIVFILLYYPVWVENYIYTDEVVQLWYYGKDPGFEMFLPQGRYVTEKLMLWLFGGIQQIDEVKWVRGFSFAGWLICIPAWYYMIKAASVKEGLSRWMPLLCTLYLVCLPSFSISVLWASCLELFLANTAGLLSGFFAWKAIVQTGRRLGVRSGYAALAIFFGVLSLFTYQNGFGCFFIPFVILFLSQKRKHRDVLMGIAAYLLITVIYFFLFKYSVQAAGMIASDRTHVNTDIFGKLKFFAMRPMSSSFNFTWLFNEEDVKGYIMYTLLFLLWLLSFWRRHKTQPVANRLIALVLLAIMFGLAYLPSLVVKENYASNRTILGLKMAVFVVVAETILYYVSSIKNRRVVVAVLCGLFFINAWYNTRYLFLKPVQDEYVKLRSFIEKTYDPAISHYVFIRPAEDLFVRSYGITRSWDEFGVPSSFFDWVPEYFVKQIVWEKTGSREAAEKLTVKHGLPDTGKEMTEAITTSTTVLEAERVLRQPATIQKTVRPDGVTIISVQ